MQLADGSMVFNITAPVTFQDTPVGSIVLGLSQDGLREVKTAAAWLMLSLAGVTIVSVAVVLFVFGGRIGKPIKLVSRSMRRFGAGDMDVRISLTRKDEVGELFEAFNAMAAAMQGGVPVESGQHDSAEHSESAPIHRIRTATRAIPQRAHEQGIRIKKRWNSALSRTIALFQSKIAVLREKTAALMARFLLVIQKATASKLEKLEAEHKAASTEEEASKVDEETAASAENIQDAVETGELLADKHPAPEIEQSAPAEARDPGKDQDAQQADSDNTVSEQGDVEGDSADLKNAQESTDPGVGVAAAKRDLSSEEREAVEPKSEKEEGGEGSPSGHDAERVSGTKKPAVQPESAKDSAEQVKESAAGTPASESESRSSAGPEDSDLQDSTIVVARPPAQDSKK
jgi:HAMP domain-containing protein